MSAKRIIAALLIAAMIGGAGIALYRHRSAPVIPVSAPPQPVAPVVPAMPVVKPKIWKLTTEVGCMEAKGFVLENGDPKIFGPWKPIGVLVQNKCAEPHSFADVKYSQTAIEYVSSKLPLRIAVLTGDKIAVAKLSRGGAICDAALALPEKCRELPVPAGSSAFIELADQTWFSLRLTGDRRIEGFFGYPQDPSKPRPIPKMPEMGFTLKPSKRP